MKRPAQPWIWVAFRSLQEGFLKKMDLIGLPENPVPPGAIMVPVLAQDGLTLRAVRWVGSTPRGTVVIAPGRGEFIEKYFEVVEELLTRHFDVVIMDWRGQGLSERELANRHKGHIDDFLIYERDLVSLGRQVLEPFCPKPWFALGHSMGGAILLAHAHHGADLFERIVLSAPMIDLQGIKFPRLARGFAEVLDIIGLGGAFIPGGSKWPITRYPFEGNVLTSDRARYTRYAAVAAAMPELTIGDPTIGWANAAFRLMRQFEEPDFARRTMTPILILAAGADRVVKTSAIEAFASRLKAGRHLTIPYARHDLLLETDAIRAQVWAAFDAFVPGTQEIPVMAQAKRA
jgi:lysophospholipase